MLDDLTELAKQKYVAPYFFAGIHIGLGENDRAIEYLEKSYEEHSHWLIYLHIDPSMDELAGQSTFPGPVAACRPSRSAEHAPKIGANGWFTNTQLSKHQLRIVLAS